MKRLFYWILILLFLPSIMNAQKPIVVSGEYTYYAPLNISPEQARQEAIEESKVHLIEMKFGSVVGIKSFSEVSSSSEASQEKFFSLSENVIKGEWLETIGRPRVEYRIENNQQVIHVTLKGRIREIVSGQTDISVSVLNNGYGERFKTNEFRNKDELYISIEAPIAGYLSVYLYDQRVVNRLLPLVNDHNAVYPIDANKKYILFANGVSLREDLEKVNPNAIYPEYNLVASGTEFNRIYILFSPNKFSKPIDVLSNDLVTPPVLEFEEFQKWLTKTRRQDKELVVKIEDIVIHE